VPVTVLDPKTALVVIDLQKGIVALPVAHPVEGILERVRTLAVAFRGRGLPVVLVNVEGGAPGRCEQPRRVGDLASGWSELVAELERQPSDHVVTKKTWGAFTNTGLLDLLNKQGITQIVLAGISTSIGIESTARQAQELGLNVTLVLDAMTDMHLDAHLNSTTRIFPRLGETGTTDDILALLA